MRQVRPEVREVREVPVGRGAYLPLAGFPGQTLVIIGGSRRAKRAAKFLGAFYYIFVKLKGNWRAKRAEKIPGGILKGFAVKYCKCCK